MKLRTMIVDDEPLARAAVRSLLACEDDVEVLGEHEAATDALRAIRETQPDLIFLDVDMPEMNGLALLEALGADETPLTILVTAHEEHALQAFELDVLDYLVKPFGRSRFQEALRRARDAVATRRSGGVATRIGELLTRLDQNPEAVARHPAGGRRVARLPVKQGPRVELVRTDEIDYLEAQGNYVRVHVGAESHLIRETMTGLEARLDSRHFLRIHRSTMVNLERVRELRPLASGDCTVVLRTGTRLRLSRSYRAALEERLGSAMVVE